MQRTLRVRLGCSIRLVAAVVGATLLAGPAHGAAPDEHWVEVVSPHFVVISNAGQERALEAAKDFELVRAVVRRTLPDLDADPRQPILIFAVDGASSLKELGPEFWEGWWRGRPAGFFQSGPHKHHIALRLDKPRGERYALVFHEYFHLLTSQNVPWLPVWLDEGLSEFWGNVRVRNDVIDFGRPAEHHLQLLRRGLRLPLVELLSITRSPHEGDRSKSPVFYAQAWALTHYIMTGDTSGQARRNLTTYLELLRRGVASVAAARTAFGDLDGLAGALDAYVGSDRMALFRLVAPPTVDEETLVVRALTPAESLARRGTFLVHGQRPRQARPLLMEALEMDPAQSLAAESLGYLHFRHNELDEARGWFAHAVALDADSYLAHFYSAILMRPRQGAAARSRIEGALRRVIELKPAFAPAYARLAALQVEGGKLDEAVALGRTAVRLEADNAGYWLDLGELLLRRGQVPQARSAGEQADLVAVGVAMIALAEEFLERVEAADKR